MEPLHPDDLKFSGYKNLGYAERKAIATLAGDRTAKRATRASSPGWVRLISGAEVFAWHESGHIVIAAALNFNCFFASIEPRPHLTMGSNQISGGLAVYSDELTQQCDPDDPHELETDDVQVEKLIEYLAMDQPDQVKEIRTRLEAKVDELIERYWLEISAVAFYLLREKNLNRERIAAILAPRRSRWESSERCAKGGPKYAGRTRPSYT